MKQALNMIERAPKKADVFEGTLLVLALLAPPSHGLSDRSAAGLGPRKSFPIGSVSSWRVTLPKRAAADPVAIPFSAPGTAVSGKKESQAGKKSGVTQVQHLSDKADRLLEQGKILAAIDAYQSCLKLDPKNARLHYRLGLALSKQGDHGAEHEQLKRALELDPKFSLAHNRLGMLYMEEGNATEAELEFRVAIEVNPLFAEAEYNLGLLYGRQGRNLEAISSMRQAIEHDPRHAQAHMNLGLLLVAQGQYLEGKQQLERAIELSPNSADAYTALGKAEAKLRRPKDSEQAFRMVVEMQPDSSDAHLNLGIVLADQNDGLGALEQFSEAVRLAPNSAIAHYNRGRVLNELIRPDEARMELETACRLSADYGAALYLLALVEKHANDVSRSTELLEKVVALEPQDADAHYQLGQNLFSLGRTEEAIQHWKMALQADPNHTESLYNLTRILTRLNRPEAKQYSQRLEEVKTASHLLDQVRPLGNQALDAADARDWTRAVDLLKRALELCGTCPETAHLHKNLGLIYARSGDRQAGEQELRMALQLDPNDEDVVKALQILKGAKSQ
jgi:tetratricopeptide (TPR) repeat protein